MAQYTGSLNEGTPGTRTEGTVTEPSTTLKGITRVVQTDESGSPVSLPPPPGSTPDTPIYTQSLEGTNNRTQVEGGYLDRIAEPVAIRGPVNVVLSDAQLATLLPRLLTLDNNGRLAVSMYADPVLPPEVNLVTVDGFVLSRPEASITESPIALTVSTTAVLIVPANMNRKSVFFVNNGSGTLYVRRTSDVASSGATVGAAITALGGSYSDSGHGVWLGEIWGIYSASATTQNVAGGDRS